MFEKYASQIIWALGSFIAVIGAWFSLKSKVNHMENRLKEHIEGQQVVTTRIKDNINTLFERDRKNVEDVTELKANMERSLANQDRILKKLDAL